MAERLSVTDLVVLDSLQGVPRSLGLEGEGERAILLVFSPDERVAQRVKADLGERYTQVEVVSAAGLLDAVALRVRDEYARLVAEAPDAIRVGDETLREAFTFEGRLSLWWLNEIFGKRSDLYPTFGRLCQLEVVRSTVEGEGVESCGLLTQDPLFWALMESYCAHEGLRLQGRRPRRGLRRLSSTSLIVVMASTLAWLARTAIQTLIAKVASWRQSVPSGPDGPVYAFHTFYNTFWPPSPGLRDMKFGASLEVLRAFEGTTAVCACTLAADGVHPSVGILDYIRLSWGWRRGNRLGLPIVLLDAFLTWGDLLRGWAQVSLLWRYYQLERSASFRAHWRYHGVSFAPLVAQELRHAMLRTPRYLVHAMRVRRFVRAVAPAVFVYHLFEFGFGKAIAYAVRTAGTGTALAAGQEGPFARRKLGALHLPDELLTRPDRPEDYIANLPLPDRIILEGRGARDLLAEAGYPRDRLFIGGAPRLSRLAELPRHGQGHGPAAPHPTDKVVLVAFGQHDAGAILAACIPVLERLADHRFMLKLHPRGGVAPRDVEKALAGRRLASSYTIETRDVYDLLATADVVVATYSSVALEAAAMGYPVVCLHLPDRVNQAPLLDFETDGVRFVSGPDELAQALAQATSQPADAPAAEELEEYFFHRLDGGSPERWSQLIAAAAPDGVKGPA